MIAELTAVDARIEALSYATHIGYTDSKAQALPYVVLGAPGWDATAEVPLCGSSDVLDAEIRVKVVSGEATGVMKALKIIRDDLSPALASSVLEVPGRVARIKYVRSEFVAPDTSVTLTNGSHPTQGVETYRITSQPVG